MSKTLKKKKHWSTKVQECTVSWGGTGDFFSVVDVRGGAELGEFPHLGHVVSEAMACNDGRLPSAGDVLLEVNGTSVSGLTNRDTLAVIRYFGQPVRLKTVKAGACLCCIPTPCEKLLGDMLQQSSHCFLDRTRCACVHAHLESWVKGCRWLKLHPSSPHS